jgi:DNA-binding transcriptional MerR regulator
MPAVATAPKAKRKTVRTKLFHKINEVGKLTALKPYVLRYWETEFPQLSPEKDENDQRRYRQKDIDLILRIKRLLYDEKFTIAGAKQRIAAEAVPAQQRPRASATPAPRPRPRSRAKAPSSGALVNAPASDALGELTAIRAELQELLALLT